MEPTGRKAAIGRDRSERRLPALREGADRFGPECGTRRAA